MSSISLHETLVVQSLTHVWLFATPWPVACQIPLFSTVSWRSLKSMSIESVMLSNHLFLCCPFLLLPSVFPSNRVFPMSQFFTSGGQSVGASASASILPMNIQGWFPLVLSGLILAVQGTLKSLLQHHNLKASVLPCSVLFSWRRKWQPTPVFLPGKSHGQRSLVGYISWGCKESNTTEQLSIPAFFLVQISHPCMTTGIP